ncbi:MAG: CHC2 zinc finger domain-containing protein [Armatimonadota bacterium]
MTTLSQEVRAYYAQVTSADIGMVAREVMGDRMTGESGDTLLCNCPMHESISGTSLHIELDKQLWRCWGCGISGDVLQLVELARHGVVTSGVAGQMTESHRDARDWLAEKLGLPKLAHLGLSDDEIAVLEARQVSLHRARVVLTQAAAWYYQQLLAHPEVMEWLQAQYAFTPEVLERFSIGYAGVSGLRDYLYAQGFSTEDVLASGLFLPNETGDESKVLPFFNQRVMFPYYAQGHVAYFIGRRTPWTPKTAYEESKYKKLLTHDPKNRPWVAPGIENARLYHEDALLRRPERVIITEGITDCITLLAQGFVSISPVTITIRHEDWARIIPKLRGVKEVVICQDNELSGAGWKGALGTAKQLEAAGITCRIAELPLDAAQRDARTQLATRFKVTDAVGQTALASSLANRPDEERADAQRLLEAAKVDVCSYFVAGHTAEEFTAILQAARSPLECAIDALTPEMPARERDDALTIILRQVATRPVVEHTRLLQAIRQRLGKTAVGMGELRTVLKDSQRTSREEHRAQAQSDAPAETSAYTDGRRSYYLVENGIVRERSRETAQGPISTREILSNFHIKIHRERITEAKEPNPDGSVALRTLLYGDIIGKDWTKPLQVEADHWGSNARLSSQITGSCGARAIFATGELDEVRMVSSAVSGSFESDTLSGFFGYHPNGGFLTPLLSIRDGEIRDNADLGVHVEMDAEYTIARMLELAPASVDEVRDLVTHLLTDFLHICPLDVMLPLLSHAFLGPVLFSGPLLEQGFMPFTLFINGSSGKGKTETSLLAQCLWGRFFTKEKMGAFGSTPESNRQEAARNRGGLWFMDDFRRQKLGSQYPNAVRILCDYADLQARRRATPGAKMIVSHPAKCMLIVNGEDLPYSEPAVIARMLIVDYHRYDDIVRFTRCKETAQRYRKVPAHFIAWWQRQDPAYWISRTTAARDSFQAFLISEGLNGDNSTRLASNAALSMIGLEAFRDFVYSLGLDPDALAGCDLCVEHTTVLQEMLRHMSRLVTDVRPADIFLHTLMQLFAAGRVRLLDGYQDDPRDSNSKVVGHYKREAGMVHLYPTIATGEVRDAYRRGEEHNLNWETMTIGKQLAEDGYLVDEDINCLQRKVRVPGAGRAENPRRVWRIKLAKFDALLRQYQQGQDN